MAEVAIFIGRFQPVHKGHLEVALRALSRHEELIIAIGSANRSRRTKNPFTFSERTEMWDEALDASGVDLDRVHYIPLDDMTYSDNEWVAQVRHRVSECIRNKVPLYGDDDEMPVISLTGHIKDSSSYYLRYFPEWESDLIEAPFDNHEATRIREFFYKAFLEQAAPDAVPGSGKFYNALALAGLPDSTPIWDEEYQDTLRQLSAEWDFDRGYDPSKFPINVVTVDAVVVQNGHVLTVRRKSRPGKGLMALPGGHINPSERLEAAALRELREETKIDFSDRVLRANIKKNEVFDDPGRSTRARVITQAYLIKLPDEEKLAKVKGGDDAAAAFWTPLSEVRAEDWFEDHAFIIQKLTAGL